MNLLSRMPHSNNLGSWWEWKSQRGEQRLQLLTFCWKVNDMKILLNFEIFNLLQSRECHRDQEREIEFPVIVVSVSHYPGEKAPTCNLLENGH